MAERENDLPVSSGCVLGREYVNKKNDRPVGTGLDRVDMQAEQDKRVREVMKVI